MDEEDISVALARELQSSGECLIIDLRRNDERAEKSIPGTIHIPSEVVTRESLSAHGFDESRHNDLIIVHCRKGGRAKRIRTFMEELGFTSVKNLEGGILEWEERGFPLEHEAEV